MSSRALNPVPSWGVVARAQLRMVALLQRREFVILGLLCAALVAVSLWSYGQPPPTWDDLNDIPPSLPVFPALGLPLAFIAAVWALSVWRSEDPTGRGYFWSLPVARSPHTLLRVAVGWTLLMGVCLVVMALWLGVTLPVDARYDQIRISLAYWWVPLVIPTLPYVFFSAMAVAFEHPLRFAGWVFAAAWVLLAIVDSGIASPVVATSANALVESIATALAAPVAAPYDGWELYQPWLPNYLGWLGLAVALLVAASFRRRKS
jgi:hypothetical protein